jgi:hypothetical protein
MSQCRVQIIILCEDRQQEVFARHFLKQRGFTGIFRSNICPSGSQSGEQYVRDRYPLEVKAYRQNRNRVSIGLVVLIDADNYSLKQRVNQLAETLDKERQDNEAIAIFVPKRNIETWIHYLDGNSIDEEESYPKLLKEGDCKPAVADLAEQCRSQSLPENIPETLKVACEEFQRLLSLLEN